MNTSAVMKNRKILTFMTIITIAITIAYFLFDTNMNNPKLFAYAMKIRTPKIIAMLISAFAIGSASIVFQSIINNRIVTPCLLGMNSMYTLIHTAIIFVVGSGSIFATNSNLAFAVDLILMGTVATLVYSYLFKKTNY